jgi:tRNA A37 threonylcarbamoyladenosine synthetase subunit TsaC/SUA5/YrdC
VDEAVARLNRLKDRPADEHVAILEEVHGRLRDILDELDETPEPPQAATGPGGQGQP